MHELKHVLLSVTISLLVCAVGSTAFAQQHPTHGTEPGPQPSTRRPAQGQDAPRPTEAPHQEHGTMMMTGALGIPKARAASGTSWLPDVTPMYAVHRQLGDWTAMLHENLFVQYIDESTARGDSQLGSVNWFMGMAGRRLGGGHFGVRTMLSLEPLTVGECGYPDLLATGESCKGRPIHDRQHPHDLFMEAAGLYEREVTRRVAVQLYAALAGEPALGPVAFPHRISALSTPIAPLTHHWLDSTHISYGVVSAGVFGARWKAEASAFNGREPDENRFDLDLAPLDSFAARLWLAPAERWSLQVSRGHLSDAELPPFGGPRVDVNRTTASATYHRLVGNAGFWSTTGAWGRNTEEDHATDAVLLETDLGLDSHNTLFARVEAAEKTGEDLVIPELADEIVGLSKLHVGYMRRLTTGGMFEPQIGAALSFSALPNRVEQAYGRESGFGVTVFLSVRPSAMPGLPGMRRAATPTPTPGPNVPEAAATRPAERATTSTAEPHAGHAGTAAAPAPSTPSTPAPAAGSRPSSRAANFAVDPVDGLKVDPSTAPQATYQSQTYYFCSEQHRELFLKSPAKFLPKELERRQ